jgi:hypothetical protein
MGATGETWNCPHCGEQILRSAASCPACQRRLRFGAVTRSPSPQNTVCPLSIDGVIRHPGSHGAWEYSVLVEVHDPKGEKLARRVVALGAIPPGETRLFTFRIELDVVEQSSLAPHPSSHSVGEPAIPDTSPLPSAQTIHQQSRQERDKPPPTS